MELWQIAKKHLRLDRETRPTNSDRVYYLLRTEYGASDFRARSAIAKACRQMRGDIIATRNAPAKARRKRVRQ